MNPELIDYINRARQQQLTDIEIKNGLTQSGWDPATVDQAMASLPAAAPLESDKEYLAASLLSFFLGFLGADRFYLSRIPTGVIKLVTFGGLGIWALIDTLLIVFGVLKDKNGLPLRGYHEHGSIVKIIVGTLTILQLVILPIVVVILVLSTFSGVQHKAKDAQRMTDIKSTAALLETYFDGHGSYPTLEQINDENFRKDRLQANPEESFQRSGLYGSKFAETADGSTYGYSPSGNNYEQCDGEMSDPCIEFELSALMEDKTIYRQQSLN